MAPRRFRSQAALICVVALSAVLAAPGFARGEAPTTLPPAPNAVVGRILVKFQEAAIARIDAAVQRPAPLETGIPSLDLLNRSAGVRDLKRAIPSLGNVDADGAIGLRRWYVLELPNEIDARQIARLYEQDVHVEAAHPSWPYTPLAVPNDPYYPDNWGHHNTAQLPAWGESCPPGCGHDMSHCEAGVGTVGFDTGMEAAWGESQGFGDLSIVIAVIDFGFDTDHPDIRYVPGWDFFDGDDDPDVSGNAHGTACAGVAAAIANNGLGVTGVAGGCSLMPIRALFPEEVAEALVWAAEHGAHIVSMSIAYVGAKSLPIVDDALAAAASSGLLLFAASGNAGDDQLWVPATHPDVVTIGAADPCGNRKTQTSCDGETWWGSSYGGATQDSAGTIDLVAPTILPSTDILGADGDAPGDYCLYFSGTSCAAPYAAGMAALVKSAHPGWTPAQVRQRLVETAVDIVNAESGVGWDRFTGYGLVSGAALTAPAVGVPPVSLTPLLSLHAHPNPFRGSIAITFAAPPGTSYRLRVYDTGGRAIRALRSEEGLGYGTVEWDGRSASGFLLPEGIYFVRLTAAGETLTRKIVRIDGG